MTESLKLIDVEKYNSNYPQGYDLESAIEVVGSNADHELWAQPAFMMSVGLRRNHKFLDFGCGCLRGTALLVDYLQEGNFYGVDISAPILSQSFKRLDVLGVKTKPNLFHIKNYDLFGMLKTKFDFILSVSILTHILPADLGILFSSIREVLSDDGKYYFSIYPTEEANFLGDIGCMFYRKDYLIQEAKKEGLLVSDIEGNYRNLCSNFISAVNTPMMGQWMMKAKKC
jgi:SAM-dependent methyltransferase